VLLSWVIYCLASISALSRKILSFFIYLHDVRGYMCSGVTSNERARGKNCVIPPSIYIFYFKGSFSAASTPVAPTGSGPLIFFHLRHPVVTHCSLYMYPTELGPDYMREVRLCYNHITISRPTTIDATRLLKRRHSRRRN